MSGFKPGDRVRALVDDDQGGWNVGDVVLVKEVWDKSITFDDRDGDERHRPISEFEHVAPLRARLIAYGKNSTYQAFIDYGYPRLANAYLAMQFVFGAASILSIACLAILLAIAVALAL